MEIAAGAIAAELAGRDKPTAFVEDKLVAPPPKPVRLIEAALLLPASVSSMRPPIAYVIGREARHVLH